MIYYRGRFVIQNASTDLSVDKGLGGRHGAGISLRVPQQRFNIRSGGLCDEQELGISQCLEAVQVERVCLQQLDPGASRHRAELRCYFVQAMPARSVPVAVVTRLLMHCVTLRADWAVAYHMLASRSVSFVLTLVCDMNSYSSIIVNAV